MRLNPTTCQVCPGEATDAGCDNNGFRTLQCEDCGHTWTPTATGDPPRGSIHASAVGKLLRAEGLHCDYGHTEPDLERGGWALGSAKAYNDDEYGVRNRKVHVIFAPRPGRTATDTMRQVYEVIADRYGLDVIKHQTETELVLED